MNETVEHIRKLLLEAKKTVSTAESITAGYLQTMLVSVSGASDFFKGGITAYKLPVKVDLLGVDEELAERTNCIDEEVARQMATGALKLFKTDYAVATCGYAETNSGTPFAFFAIADAIGTTSYSQRVDLTGSRVEAQKQAAQLALEKLEELLRTT